jgi:hypothetical protein
MKKLSFLIIENDLMFCGALLTIVGDLFPGCIVETTDTSSVLEESREEQLDVVLCGHEHEFLGAGILQKIKTQHPDTMTILEGILGIGDDAKSRVDYLWPHPFRPDDLGEAIENFFREKEE